MSKNNYCTKEKIEYIYKRVKKMGMSIREAIKKMGCEEISCDHLDPKGAYSFCKAIFTDKFCKEVDKRRKQEIEAFYSLAEKYGFIRV